MGTKINAIVSIVIVVIFLFIIIRFKIKSDKKRKSLAIQSVEREKNNINDKNYPYNETINPKVKKSFLSTTPSAVLAILTIVGATILVYGIGVGLGSEGLDILKDSEVEVSGYIIYCLIIAACCFLIVKQNPRSIWYVPIICNLITIIPAIFATGFWGIICSGWVLSIIASIIGALMGKRKAISNNH
jgi:large-conductance mechanosensitive channel